MFGFNKQKQTSVRLTDSVKPTDTELKYFQNIALIVARMQQGPIPVQWFNWSAEYLEIRFYRTPSVGSYVELDEIVLLNEAAIKWCKDNGNVV